LLAVLILFILCLVLNGRAIATTQKKLKAIPPQLQDIQAAQAGGHCQTKLSYSKPNKTTSDPYAIFLAWFADVGYRKFS
jgi:hypothetical protein